MTEPTEPTLPVTGDPEADKLLADDPLALMIGMLLDQQVPMEWAFSGPLRLREKLGGRLDAAEIADLDPAALEANFRGPPALHRYPGSMAKRTQALCQYLVENYGGDAAAVWAGVDEAASCCGGCGRCRASVPTSRRSSPLCWPSASTSGPRDGNRRPLPSPTTTPARWPTSIRPNPCSECGPGRRR
jgi:hypothetical protein